MAEESFQEKTEEATPKRREDAREKGQVARPSRRTFHRAADNAQGQSLESAQWG